MNQNNVSNPFQAIPIKWRLPLLIGALVIVVSFFFFGGKPHDWWNGSWSIRKPVIVDTAGIDGAIGTTPVLVRLHDGNFKFDQAQESGGDIRFILDGKPLQYSVEKFDSLLAEAFVWVQVPDLKPGAQTKLWLYYGSTNTSAPGGVNAKGGYDDTLLAYHFAEAPGQTPKDASGHGNDAQNAASTESGSFIGSGLKMDAGTNVQLPASLTWGDALTWSAWVRFPAAQANGILFSAPGSLTVGIENGIPYADINGQRTSGGAPMLVNSWSHIAVTAQGGTVTLYLNGASYGTVSAAFPAPTGAARIGGGFIGQLDELEISKVARPAGFIKMAALSQGQESGAKVVALGDDKEAGGSGGPGIYGVILKSVTIDGWVIIAVLVGMGILSWRVMVGKWDYLKKNAAANELFAKEWRHVASDLTQLDHNDAEKSKTMGGRLSPAVKESSLYRIYHIGAEEIRHRMAQDGSKVLSAQSIQAIRASLDAGLVREIERLNDKMVILTISISGGPFVGLLGTVAGVMITFAAIAAAGEVNVNSIAPGISAALVATVAGLLVAIPALFGYNLLTTRIDAATGDMQVFIDEYVTKMAEFYRGRVPVAALNGESDGLLDALVARLAKAARN
jgi:biopolymer transport protein ExbB